MSETFTNILTKIGQQKKAQAEASGVALNITTFKVGDGNGSYYEPNENQTALVNVKYSGNFAAGTQSQIVLNSSNLNEVLYKCFIPADIGGFTIRELGLFDVNGNLILICKLPAQDKFALASGLYQPLTFTPKIIYTNPQTQAVLTPISQTIPTIGEVTTLIETAIAEYVPEIIYTDPIKNTDGTISLEIDSSLKVVNKKLGVASVLSCLAPLTIADNVISIRYDDTLKLSSGALGAVKIVPLPKFALNSGNTTSGNSDLLSYTPLPYIPWTNPKMTSFTAPGGTVICPGRLHSGTGYSAFSADGSETIYYRGYSGIQPASTKYQLAVGVQAYITSISPEYTVGYSYIHGTGCSVRTYLNGVITEQGNYIFSSGLTFATPTLADAIEYYNFYGGGHGDLVGWCSFPVNGYIINPSGGSGDYTKLSFKVGGSYPNLVLTYADNSQETLASLNNIAGLSANGAYTIVKEKGSNPVAINTTASLKALGTSISGGDYSGYTKDGAFNGSSWFSSQQGTSINGVANIGKNWSNNPTINGFILNQASSSSQSQTSIKYQTSINGTTWTDVQTFSGLTTGLNTLTLTVPSTPTYWRFLANSAGTAGYSWGVYNIEILGNINAVTQDKIFPTSPSNGDYHCLTANGLQTYKRVSGAWVETQYVPIGTVTVSGAVITAVTTNSYNQNGYDVNKNTAGALTKYWVSGEYLPVLGTETVVTHNLNLANPLLAKSEVLLKCLVAEFGYSVGDYIGQWASDASGVDLCYPNVPLLRTNTISIRTANQEISSIPVGGSYGSLTPANWRYVFKVWY